MGSVLAISPDMGRQLMWGSIGKWVGKGVMWLIRHPEAIGAIKQVVDKAKDDKTPPDPVN
jgi:hypothetical protein